MTAPARLEARCVVVFRDKLSKFGVDKLDVTRGLFRGLEHTVMQVLHDERQTETVRSVVEQCEISFFNAVRPAFADDDHRAYVLKILELMPLVINALKIASAPVQSDPLF